MTSDPIVYRRVSGKCGRTRSEEPAEMHHPVRKCPSFYCVVRHNLWQTIQRLLVVCVDRIKSNRMLAPMWTRVDFSTNARLLRCSILAEMDAINHPEMMSHGSSIATHIVS
uniref:AlNc14C88G5596 protein n=1 Tax=Albugo laibachii Nc14 TaxID=890382 RepID=F0WG66_9STRA|nr:AlNc14C88G5596 [Albugo laibachii Nc14]|eukprot:CCA20201.1 AlNc14C88G5596 [Albugo laibachii Nc14]